MATEARKQPNRAKRTAAGPEKLTEVFGLGRFSESEGQAIRRKAREEDLSYGQVIRKYCLKGLSQS